MFAPTEIVSIYRSSATIRDDKNVVTSPYTLEAENIACNLHRGVKEARDQLLALGVIAPEYAVGFFELAAEDHLNHWWIVLDEDRAAWLIHARPVVRKRFAATQHVRCLLTLLRDKPNGVP
jgi:hypothetical protein